MCSNTRFKWTLIDSNSFWSSWGTDALIVSIKRVSLSAYESPLYISHIETWKSSSRIHSPYTFLCYVMFQPRFLKWDQTQTSVFTVINILCNRLPQSFECLPNRKKATNGFQTISQKKNSEAVQCVCILSDTGGGGKRSFHRSDQAKIFACSLVQPIIINYISRTCQSRLEEFLQMMHSKALLALWLNRQIFLCLDVEL